METIITLNVGGKIFQTKRDILIRCKYFRDMLSDCNDQPTIFLDCNPDKFEHILAYLRFAGYQIPADCKYLCDYFMIDGYDVLNLKFIIAKGDLDLIKKLIIEGKTIPIDLVVRNNHKHIVNWAYKKGIYEIREIFNSAINAGNIDIIEWCFDNGYEIKNNVEKNNCYNICRMAARTGNLELLKYLIKKGFLLELDFYIGEAVAIGGNIEMMEYILSLGTTNVKNNDAIMLKAAAIGKLTMMKWLIDNGFKYNKDIFKSAVKSRNLDLIKYLETIDNFKEISVFYYAFGTLESNIEVLDYLLKNNYPYDKNDTNLLIESIRTDNLENFIWMIKNMDLNLPNNSFIQEFRKNLDKKSKIFQYWITI